MILSNQDIRQELYDGDLEIDPIESKQIQPASVDLTLGREFIVDTDVDADYRSLHTDPNSVRTIERKDITVGPGEFVLAHTRETVSIPRNIVAEVKGRSSVGRMGLTPHTAGWVDPGFEGQITLELTNHGEIPVVLYEGDRIAQMIFTYTNERAAPAYGEQEGSKYQGQTGVTDSRSEKR